MTRTLSKACFLFAAVAAVALAVPVVAGPGAGMDAPAGATSRVGTPLPPGWELCIIGDLNAPATQANIADLDEWQAAEGGSTNNTAAYNPFNTMRTTDNQNDPLPIASMVGGFPAFPDWLTGCAATVATLLQPNMWTITAALRAGNVSPPGQFLVDVDGSAWCAVSASGQPCYLTQIAATGGSIPGLVASSALNVLGNVQSDVTAYQAATLTVAGEQNTESERNADVAAAEGGVTAAEGQYKAIKQKLQTFAISEYVHNGLYQSTDLGTGAAPLNETNAQSTAQEYASVAAGDLVDHIDAALAALQSARARLGGADRALQGASSALLADVSTENRALKKLLDDLATMQTAGACTAVDLTGTAGSTAAAAGAQGSGSGTGAGAGATTTTTTTAPSTAGAPATTSTSSTTTTTTAPPDTTTTVLGSSTTPDGGSATTTSTTVAPAPSSTTTTTTAPPTTTTSTTQPAGSHQGSGSSATKQVQQAQLGALQGCVSALNAPGSA